MGRSKTNKVRNWFTVLINVSPLYISKIVGLSITLFGSFIKYKMGNISAKPKTSIKPFMKIIINIKINFKRSFFDKILNDFKIAFNKIFSFFNLFV